MAIKQTWRGFVSLTLFISAFFSCFTGIVLYFVPQGRVARWTLWEFLGMGKDPWGGVHTLSSFLFVIFFVFHVINNIKPIKAYIVKKTGGLNQGKQLLAAVVISAVIVVSGALELPPLQYVMDFGEYLKTFGVDSPEQLPPFGHAEEVPMTSFCRKMDIDVNKALDLMRENGMEVEGKESTLADVARRNNTSPLDIYMLIRELEELPMVAPAYKGSKGETATSKPGWTDTRIKSAFSQPGQGRKSVADIARQLDIPVEKALKRLAKYGIVATAEDRLRDLKGIVPEGATATDVIRIMAMRPEKE